ncbi:conserved hypothetical protein [Sphingomonas sp. 8AM]|nr:conserved hypothetical protein [Sphingomonas sp. 8AM]
MSPKHRRVVTELSLEVLQEAMRRTGHRREQVAAIRLALRCLWPVCADKALLTAFWDAITREVDIGREHGLERSFGALRAAVVGPPPRGATSHG